MRDEGEREGRRGIRQKVGAGGCRGQTRAHIGQTRGGHHVVNQLPKFLWLALPIGHPFLFFFGARMRVSVRTVSGCTYGPLLPYE